MMGVRFWSASLFLIVLISVSIYSTNTKQSSSQQVQTVFEPVEIKNTNHESVRKEDEDSSAQRANNPEEQPDIPSYQVDLNFDPESGELKGMSEITVWNLEDVPLDTIKLHAFLNEFQTESPPILKEHYKKAYPNGVKPTIFTITSIKLEGSDVPYSMNESVLTIKLPSTWEQREKKTITLTWEATIPKSINLRFGSDGTTYWFGNSLPLLAVYNDEWKTTPYLPVGDPFYTDTANFNVSLTIPTEYLIVSTGSEIDSQVNGEKKTYLINASKVRDFAFAVAKDYKTKTTTTESGKTINFYYHYANPDTVARYTKMAADMLTYLEDRIGPYSGEELDIFETHVQPNYR